jgi:hypothetical protein
MLNLSEGQRHYFQKKRALATDAEGREIFVGLSHDESERFHFLSDPSRPFTQTDSEEFQRLDSLHRRARRITPTSTPQETTRKVKVSIGHEAYAVDVPSMQAMSPKDYLSYVKSELFFVDHHDVLNAAFGGYPIATTSAQVKTLIHYLNAVADRMHSSDQ